MKSVVIIPARFNSSRLPGKVLANINGKPMLQHVYEAARAAACEPDVIVATDDERVLRAVESFGGRVVKTSGAHESGTDRIAEVAENLDHDIVINVQADEPMLRPDEIDLLVDAFLNPAVQMASLCRPMCGDTERMDPNRVKVVVDSNDDAVSFERLPTSDKESDATLRVHLGIYAYQRARLQAFARLPQTQNERRYALEQLRAMDEGWRIRMIQTEWAGVSVDTADDLKRVRYLMRARRGGADAHVI